MTDVNRTAVAVTFLSSDPEARRLALAWPLVPHGRPVQSLFHEWSLASGVSLSRTVRVGEVLLRHGICRDDGSLDPEAIRVVQHIAAEALRTTKNRRSG